jgi:hypothetical protein
MLDAQPIVLPSWPRPISEQARMRLRIARAVGIATVYLLACWIMLAPICNFANLASASYEGDARLVIWLLAWDNHALLDRVPALFDANIFFPARNALAYSEHMFGISLFSLPVYALTRNAVLSYNLVWLLSFFMAGVIAHWLTWRSLRDHVAATVGGLAFAFCFYRMHQGHGHLHMIWSFGIPLSLIAMERYVEVPSWGRLSVLGAVAVLQALGSWYQAVLLAVADVLFLAWLIFVEGVGLPWFGRHFRDAWRNEATRRWLGRFVLRSAAGAAVALLVIWPFARHYTVLASATPAGTAADSADLAGFLIPAENTFIGQWMLAHGIKGPRWIWGEVTVYLGWITVCLAALGTVVSLRKLMPSSRRLQFFALLALVSLSFAVGPSSREVAAGSWGWSPFGLLMRIPGIDLFRAPARFTELLTLALAVLAAAGCAWLRARFGRVGTTLTIAAIPVLLCEFYVVNFPSGAPEPFPIAPIYQALETVPPGAVVSLPDYADTALWFREANYQYYSTAHWRPIANGYSRSAPPGFRLLINQLSTFPSASAAAAIRTAGIRYVVFHAHQIENGPGLVSQSAAGAEFQLVAQRGDDYLFEVLPVATPAK